MPAPADTTAPVITLNGAASLNITQNSPYLDAGATALDDVDGNITANIVINNSVDPAVLGTYTVTYNVSDAAGNAAIQLIRTVTVSPPADTSAPVITLNGAASLNIRQNSPYLDAGATALDDVDGNITANIVINNSVDTAVLGTYTVTYNVSDAAGNAAVQVTRTVTVTPPADTTAPVITLTGAASLNITQNSTYLDAGATALDNVDGDLTAMITTTNPVDTAVLGTYSVTYDVSDAAGNAAQKVRVVNVVTPPPPATTVTHPLNDTGITACGNATGNNLVCPQTGFPNQDAEQGRDAQAAAGTLVKVGAGRAGFDFTKIGTECVQDNHTGLMWEVKQAAGSGGLRDASHTYTWYNSTGINDGGNSGTANGGVCVDTVNCDVHVKSLISINLKL